MIRRLLIAALAAPLFAVHAAEVPVPVNVHNFVRAETDMYFARIAAKGGFARLQHQRQPTAVDKQDVIRMNRDTLYSAGVFDLQAGAVSVILPEVSGRYMALQVISEDHYTVDVSYTPGRHTYTREAVGTRYAFLIVRVLANADDAQDIAAANAVQDAITVNQASAGSFEVPAWDAGSRSKVRNALAQLGELGGITDRFGTRKEVDPLDHLIGTATGWAGNPRREAIYDSVYPRRNDGKTAHELTVRDVPVDGFWSITVYEPDGYIARDTAGSYALSNLTAVPNPDGSVTVRFGNCGAAATNCLSIMPGWNYTVRLYRPRSELLNGSWRFPRAEPL
ncbi:hypothetical protein LMG26411_07026 [Cupriavidus numazuensis]|uniref:Carboxylesterase n=2 Tax=Cupriavidus numazuensis TaxID=221992 RepID=A0ABM8TTN3_9BURK|nr:hypothetical protein LMG26411_07026 [Cupriavidus numazuensis]